MCVVFYWIHGSHVLPILLKVLSFLFSSENNKEGDIFLKQMCYKYNLLNKENAAEISQILYYFRCCDYFIRSFFIQPKIKITRFKFKHFWILVK